MKSDDSAWSEDERARQRNALNLLVHRGPDDASEAVNAGYWMGFQRLAILDLTPNARQPMSFGEQQYLLTFNGEIYNFKELRQRLTDTSIESTGDTAVLGNLLQRFGVNETLPLLRGMFAFAWRDSHDQSVILARDHFGIKPLYYSVSNEGHLLYSSELRALNSLRNDCDVSKSALSQVFRWGAVQAPDTMFNGVKCLEPGHLLRWKRGQVRVEQWFRPEWTSPNGNAATLSEVREGIIESVQSHLISDVPVGVFLSGGLDSSMLTACMREAGQTRIKAFSIGYESNSGVPSESSIAKRTADYYGCDFYEMQFNANSLESLLDSYFDSMDQPTGDGLNTWLVAKLASQEVKVALSGLGADEWWAGYNSHRLIALARRSPFKMAGNLARSMNQLLPLGLREHKAWKAAFYGLGGAGRTISELHDHGRSILSINQAEQLLGLRTPPVHSDVSTGDWLNDLLLRETETYLANTLLRDNDWTSMAHSLELRVPLVDRNVFQLAGRVPAESKLGFSQGKRVLRKAFQNLLPQWINETSKKHTFTLPLMKWMRTPRWQERIREALNTSTCVGRGWFDSHFIQQLCNEYFNSTIESKAAWGLSQKVWLLFVVEEWAKRHVSGELKRK